MTGKVARCMVMVPKAGKVCGEVAGVILPDRRAACVACALREISDRRDIQQKDIADQLGISRETVNRIMRGTRQISAGLRLRVQKWAIEHV